MLKFWNLRKAALTVLEAAAAHKNHEISDDELAVRVDQARVLIGRKPLHGREEGQP